MKFLSSSSNDDDVDRWWCRSLRGYDQTEPWEKFLLLLYDTIWRRRRFTFAVSFREKKSPTVISTILLLHPRLTLNVSKQNQSAQFFGQYLCNIFNFNIEILDSYYIWHKNYSISALLKCSKTFIFFFMHRSLKNKLKKSIKKTKMLVQKCAFFAEAKVICIDQKTDNVKMFAETTTYVAKLHLKPKSGVWFKSRGLIIHSDIRHHRLFWVVSVIASTNSSGEENWRREKCLNVKSSSIIQSILVVRPNM